MSEKNKESWNIAFYLSIVLLILVCIALGILVSYFILNKKDKQIEANYFEEKKKIQALENSRNINEEIKGLEDLVKLKNTVVKIETQYSQGSGVFINKEGYILTNWHVIEDEKDMIRIKYVNEKDGIYMDERPASLVEYDPFLDLALLKLDESLGPVEVEYLEFGNVEEIFDGQRIIAIGSPKGLTNTMSEGIISSIRKDGKRTDLQITAPISQGSSGGALLNGKGKLIGITTYKVIDGDNLNFAVSLNDIIEFLNKGYDSFEEYKEKKKILGEGSLRDYHSENIKEFIIFSENLKEDRVYISPGYKYDYSNEKLLTGNCKIAYSSDGNSFDVDEIDFYPIHNNVDIDHGDGPLLNRDPKDVQRNISFFENRKQIYPLKSKDLNYQDLLLIGSYYQDDIWNIMFLSLEDGEFIEWGLYESGGWSDNNGYATYIRRLYSNELEIIIEYEGINYYSKYMIDSFDKSIIAIGDREKISNIDEFIRDGEWIKIGRSIS